MRFLKILLNPQIDGNTTDTFKIGMKTPWLGLIHCLKLYCPLVHSYSIRIETAPLLEEKLTGVNGDVWTFWTQDAIRCMALQVSAAAASIAVTRAIGSWLARSCRWGQPPSPIWWRIGRMKWLFSKPPESTLAYRKVEFDVDWILQCVLDAAPFFYEDNVEVKFSNFEFICDPYLV